MKKLTLAFACLTLVNSFNAAAINLDPYLGIDAQYNQMKFNPDDGARFKKWAPQVNHYVGLQLNENFAFELGYEGSKKTSNTTVIYTGERFFGRNVAALDNASSQIVELKSRTTHFNLVGLYPLYSNTEVIASAGVSWVNLTGYSQYIQPAPLDNALTPMYGKNKAILEFGAGLKYMINEHFAFRGMLNWQNKAKLDAITGTSVTSTLFANPKNSFKAGIGLIFYPLT